jgi:threonine dehydrogenase-like Zn-dependent dehydrogenase
MTNAALNKIDSRAQHSLSCGCKAWWLTGPSTFVASEVEHTAAPKPGQVRIKVVANGHCESDTNVARAGRHASQSEGNTRIMLGHEPVGIVVAIGAGVSKFKGGELVAIEPGISCGECVECKAGRYNICRKVSYMATPAKDWNVGSYVHELDWPADLAHLVPEGLDPLVAALTESMAAGREAIEHMCRTVDFDPKTETVWILGAGQMAANILLQLRLRFPELKIGVAARKEEDRVWAEKMGAAFTMPLSAREWKIESRVDSVLHAASKELLSAEAIHEKVAEYEAALAHNKPLHAENVATFKKARELSGEKIACVIECTGQPHILNAALEARMIRGEGMYMLVSCLYHMSLDIANIRRDSGVVTNLRRSRNKFPDVIADLAKNEAHYRQLLGRVVQFDEIPQMYDGFKGEKIGDGPKVVIQYS